MKKIFGLFIIMLSMMLFNNNVLAYEEYDIGDKITYNGEDYYVIEYSDPSVDYVTLLKANPLTVEDLYKYGTDENGHLFVNEYIINKDNPEEVVDEYNDGSGGMAYYTSETCMYEYIWGMSSYISGNEITTGCTVDYDNSDVKKVLDNWSNSFSEDLKEVNGYKVRLITLDELIDKFGYIFDNNTQRSYRMTKVTPEWVNTPGHEFNSSYWTMGGNEDSNVQIYKVKYASLITELVYNNAAVRPVINLDKCALVDNYKTEKVTRYKKYNIGDEIEYKGEKYYVIEKSNGKKNYVTLLKENPLVSDEINKYNNIQYESEDGTIPYYKSDDCYYNDFSDYTSGCTTDYNQSIAKTVVDNWANDKLDLNDLVEVDGYKARLIAIEDLIMNLGYDYHITITEHALSTTEEVPDWVYNSNYSYWTMSGYADSNVLIYTVLYDGIVTCQDYSLVFKNYMVRPVINLNKCVLEDGCWEEETEVKECVGDNNVLGTGDSKTTVSVGNTLNTISTIILIVSIILIVGGLSVLLLNYNKSKKEKNSIKK